MAAPIIIDAEIGRIKTEIRELEDLLAVEDDTPESKNLLKKDLESLQQKLAKLEADKKKEMAANKSAGGSSRSSLNNIDDSEDSDLEQDKHELEKEKLELERERFEESKKNGKKPKSGVMKSVGNALTYKVTIHPGMWFWALAALLIHLTDVLYCGLRRGSGEIWLMLVIYAFFTFFICVFYYQTGFDWRAIGQYASISLLAFALPFILSIPYLGSVDNIKVLVMILPVWFIYIGLNQDESRFLRWLAWTPIIVMIVALMIIVLSKVNLPGIEGPSRNLGQAFSTFWIELKDSWATIKERFTKSGVLSYSQWEHKINQTFNPDAIYYAGQVEQNKEEPTGVFITKLSSLNPTTYVGESPVIFGRIEAKTFVPGGVRIHTSCRLERAGKEGYVGVSSAENDTIDVNYKIIRDVTCQFPVLENVTPGTYYGVLGAVFDFETWAYVTNTFVSRNLIEQYYRQGKDINTALDIPTQTEAIYTNGPASLGVTADQQPIDIDLDARNNKFIQQRFGFTLANRWSQGVLEDVYRVNVLVPEPFKLENCLPAAPAQANTVIGPDGSSTSYTNYTFSKEAIKFDQRNDFHTVTCELALPSKEAAQQIVAFGEKTPVTFIVLARYQYQLEKKTPVKVSK
jgi:hypothetical protein